MFSTVERMLAFRYLRARKADGFISVVSGFSLVGIALGVATLIVVMAVMNGFRQELFSRILGMEGHVYVTSSQPIEDYRDWRDRLLSVTGVVEATPLIEGQVMLMQEGRSAGAMVRGMAIDALREKPLLRQNTTEAAKIAFEEGGVLLGYRLAHHLGLQPGDLVTFVSPQTRATVMGSIPRMKAYPVAGLMELGMYEYDNGMAILPMAEAQRFFSLPDAVNAIELRVAEPMQAIRQVLAVRQTVPREFQVYDWKRTHQHFVNALQVERNVMFLILTLIILVAAFNIISSLIMLVKDKRGDIAILRTMGASRGEVLRIFFLAGASIGVLGTCIGVGLGLAFAMNIEGIRQWLESLTGAEFFAAEIYFLSTLPADVQSGEVLRVVTMALTIAFLAPLYPAWRAARTDPAEALRYV